MPDIMVAKLSGAVQGTVATVKVGKDYYFRGPDGNARKVPADSLTDCMNYSVWEMNQALKGSKKKKG
jgi:hypothetical protein